MSVPQVNATLTSVTGPTGSLDFDTGAGAGQVKWSGRVGVYYLEDPRLTRDETRADRVTEQRLYIPFAMRDQVREGDTLTVTLHAGGGVLTAVVEAKHLYPFQDIAAPVVLILRAA